MFALLRPAEPSDLQTVAEIWHEGWWDAHPFLADKLGAARTLESFVERMAPRLGKTTVADVDGRVVGMCVVVGDELEQLYVDRSARGKGVARQLIEHAEQQVAAAGFEKIWLAVATENHPARRFYLKSGWAETREFEYQAETADGPVPVACYRCERQLPGR